MFYRCAARMSLAAKGPQDALVLLRETKPRHCNSEGTRYAIIGDYSTQTQSLPTTVFGQDSCVKTGGYSIVTHAWSTVFSSNLFSSYYSRASQ